MSTTNATKPAKSPRAPRNTSGEPRGDKVCDVCGGPCRIRTCQKCWDAYKAGTGPTPARLVKDAPSVTPQTTPVVTDADAGTPAPKTAKATRTRKVEAEETA